MEIDNRYWAGLFDGEGNIYFAKDLVHLKVAIAQKEIAILFLLRNRFGGRVSQYGIQNTAHWECFNKWDMTKFLQAVQPYAIIKAIEVRIALEILDRWNTRHSRNGNGGRGRTMSIEELNRRKVLKEKFDCERALAKTTSPIT